MNFKAYSFNLSKLDLHLLNRFCGVVAKAGDSVEIIDLLSYPCNPDPGDIVFTFGQRAKNICSTKQTLATINFPSVSKLHSVKEESNETPERLEALETLLRLKSALDNNTLNELCNSSKTLALTEKVESAVITESDLPDLTADSLKILERNLRQQGKTGFRGITHNGKSIYVSILPEDNPADIVLTFSELYAVRLLMEALDVRELQIVYKSTTNSRESTSK